ncbi:MAG: DUF4352 domain-containing protein [Chloroflexi bacterium HGW-Chloroflexi-8]|jgi:hypothetical protein|nr:MAG: DUF4352 domain-containing protein [Chloroflexi bacterium HGW-Chloroflexi-8]
MNPFFLNIGRKPWLVLVILILLSIACGTSTSPALIATSVQNNQSQSEETESKTPDSQTNPTQAPTAVVLQTYKVGDVISIGDHNLMVLGWEVVPGNDFSSPEEGKKFVAVELLIVNNGSTPISVSTLLQMSMKDETGQKYDTDFMASSVSKNSNLDGELVSGEKIRGKVGFQIAEEAQGLQFVFDDSVWGTGKIFVELGDEAITLDPPAELVGESVLQTYNIGDVIELGKTTITVNNVTSPVGDQFTKPDDGYKFLIVDLTIENKGTEAITVSTLLQMAVKDSNSYKYGVDLMASTVSGGTTPDGEIAPGEKVKGQVGFQVPENASGLLFVFDADVWGTGKAFISLP